jgi:hypothetical protein
MNTKPFYPELQIDHPDADGLVLGLLCHEGGGNILTDLSGLRNDGTINGPTWAAGQSGSALSCDGVDDYVSMGNILSGLTFISASMWFRTSATAFNSVPFGKGSVGGGATNDEWIFQFDSFGNLRFGIYNTSSISRFVQVAPAVTAQDDQWHFAAATYDGSTIRTYFDGSFSNSAAQSGSMQTTTVQLRVGSDDGSQKYTGSVDDVRIYNRALQPDEIRRIYTDPWAIYREPSRISRYAAAADTGGIRAAHYYYTHLLASA